MDDNLYKSPQSNVDQNEKGSAVKAVIIALVVDLVVSLLGSMIIGVIYALILTMSGASPEQMLQIIEQDDPFSAFSLVAGGFGLFVTAYAGYLCAKIANYSEFKVVAVFAALIALIGFGMGYGGHYSLAMNVMMSLASVPMAYAGAWVYVNKKRKIFITPNP